MWSDYPRDRGGNRPVGANLKIIDYQDYEESEIPAYSPLQVSMLIQVSDLSADAYAEVLGFIIIIG